MDTDNSKTTEKNSRTTKFDNITSLLYEVNYFLYSDALSVTVIMDRIRPADFQ